MEIIRAQMAKMSLILAHILLKWYIQKDDSDSQRISLSLRLFKLWKMRLRRRQENLKCKDDLYIGYTTFKKWFVLFQFPLSTAKWNIFRIFSRTICSTKEKEGKKGFIKRLFRPRILVTNNREFWLNFCIVFCFFFFFLPSKVWPILPFIQPPRQWIVGCIIRNLLIIIHREIGQISDCKYAAKCVRKFYLYSHYIIM